LFEWEEILWEREREQDLRATIYTYNVSSARAGEFVRDFELFFENQSTEIAIGGKRRSSFCSLVLLLLLWAVSEALCLCLFGEWSEFFFFFLRKRAEWIEWGSGYKTDRDYRGYICQNKLFLHRVLRPNLLISIYYRLMIFKWTVKG